MLKFILLGLVIIAVMFFFDIIFPMLKTKFNSSKESREREKRKKSFRKKMKELEIK